MDACHRGFFLVKWRMIVRLSPRFCDLLDAATFNALLIEFCTALISFTDRFDEVPLALPSCFTYFHFAILTFAVP